MSRSTGTKAASLIAALLLCMVLTQTAFAVEDVVTLDSTSGSGMTNDVLLAGKVATGAGNGTTEVVDIGDVIVDPTPGNNQVEPSFDTRYIMAGNKVSFTASFTNKGNETITLTPKLVAIPNSQHEISENWIAISPANATVAPGSVQKFNIVESIPKDVESESYQGQIAFTDDLVPNSADYVNSLKLNIIVQAQPKIELQTTYLSDNTQAGKEYVYKINVKNIANEDVTIDPKLINYYSGLGQAFGDDAIEISAPSTIKTGEVAILTIKVHVPESATGSYNGNIEMNVNGKANDGSNPQLGLSFNVWRQPVAPFVKNFNTKTNAPITIEVSTDNYNANMGLRVSPKEEKPSFKLELTRNSKNVNTVFVKSVDGGIVNLGSYYPIPILENENGYQNFNGHYAETYTAPGAIGNWKLSILPKNTNNFGYSITVGDANPKK